jgi:hypothetical protein
MILALLAACGGGEPTPAAQPATTLPTAQPAQVEPMLAQAAGGAHTRLWLTAADLPRLRSWATDESGVLAPGP